MGDLRDSRIRNEVVVKFIFKVVDDLIKEFREDFVGIGIGSYFIWDHAVYDFRLWSTPGWIYRVWLNYSDTEDGNYLPVSYQFLMEHYETLDKFKPSRVVNQANSIKELKEKVKIISSDPVQAFVVAYWGLLLESPNYELVGSSNEDKTSFNRKVFTDYWKNKRKKQVAVNYVQQVMLPKLLKDIMALDKGISSVGLYDWGNCCWPRYDLFVSAFKLEDVERTCCEIDRLIEEMNKLVDEKFSEIDLDERVSWLGNIKRNRTWIKSRCSYFREREKRGSSFRRNRAISKVRRKLDESSKHNSKEK
jgi:hypothetical protein